MRGLAAAAGGTRGWQVGQPQRLGLSSIELAGLVKRGCGNVTLDIRLELLTGCGLLHDRGGMPARQRRTDRVKIL
ncbi:MAG TPA: hypothetical protein VF359_02025 [Anaerolineales bacterium]